MFAQYLRDKINFKLLENNEKNNSGNVSERLFIKLLNSDKKEISKILKTANKLTIKHFGKNIILYNPVYISSFCANRCVYCNYNERKNVSRKKLSMEEFEEEINYLYSGGLKNLLIVAGQSENEKDRDFIVRCIKKAKQKFYSVSLEIGSYSENTLRNFKEAGADSFILYQETYNRKVYSKYHLKGIKKDFNYRLNSIDYAARAGFDRVGLGALLGLYDYKFEALCLYHHINYLYNNYPGLEICLSLPRINTEGISFCPGYKVNNLDFLKLTGIFRICFPNLPIYISTRENRLFRDRIIYCGATHMSAGARTSVGGYTMNKKSANQFEISDKRNFQDFVKGLEKKGYYPVMKSWDSSF
ncbi:MAG: radical SAM protein [Candidatus Muiribacteriota bacterium]